MLHRGALQISELNLDYLSNDTSTIGSAYVKIVYKKNKIWVNTYTVSCQSYF